MLEKLPSSFNINVNYYVLLLVVVACYTILLLSTKEFISHPHIVRAVLRAILHFLSPPPPSFQSPPFQFSLHWQRAEGEEMGGGRQ